MNTFASILDRPSTDVERPKALPVGSYVMVVQGLPRFDKSSKKQTEFVEFTCRYLQAQDDVDDEELTKVLERPDGTRKALSEMSNRLTFYLTEDAIWRLKKFLAEDLGIDEEDKTLRQMISEAPGQQFLAAIKHTASEDGTTVYANIATTAAVE